MDDKNIAKEINYWVLPSDCQFNSLPKEELSGIRKLYDNCLITQERVLNGFPNIKWGLKSNTFLPTSYNWLCTGCTLNCKCRKCKKNGKATNN